VLLSRLVALFRGSRLEEDLDLELRAHVEMATELNLRRGMPADEARREALREFGGLEQVKELYRDQRSLPLVETAIQDLRFGLRMLRRNPGFSVLALSCLTLGIGANAAVFSWIEGILLRPYPLVAHQERLFAIAGTNRGEAGPTGVSWPDLRDLRARCTLVESFIAEKITGTTLSVGDRAERAAGSVVSANYFDAIDVRPVLGRGFLPEEDAGRDAHPVTVISYRLWQDRFHGDPGVVGKTQVLNGLPHTIVGVAPEGFYGTFVGYALQFWVPASMQAQFDAGVYKLEDRGARWIEGFVRPKPGVTLEQAQDEISEVARRLEKEYPETNRGRGIRVFPLWQTPFNSAGALLPTLGVALAVVTLVLLIACANVSTLLVVRSFARRHEMTVRLALGCGHGRLLRQLFTEGLILSALAAAGGLVVAYWLRDALVLLMPWRGVPLHVPGELDARVLGLSAGVCLVTTLLVSLVPAWDAGKVDLASALKSESGGVVGGRGRSWLRSGLVVLQVSLSFMLLVGAGLVVRTVLRIGAASPGFATRGVLTTAVNLFAAGYDAPRARHFQDELIDRVQALPGVESAAYSRITPFSYRDYSSAPIGVDGYAAAPDEQPTADYNEVGPAYFATLRIPVVSGREFTRADDESAPLVAIVNEAMAAQYWPRTDPVGQRLASGGRSLRVVGVVKTSKYRSFAEAPQSFFYVPLRQSFSSQVGLQIRTALGPEAMTAALAGEIHALDPDVAPYEVITMREQVDRSTSPQRIAVTLLGVFGGLTLLLAAVGLYGVLSQVVSQATRELGLRTALGASPADLLSRVIAQGLALTAGGVMLGGAAAGASTRLLGYLLYEVSPRDPLAFGAAMAVMTAAALAASLVPGWRAARIDPVRALRD
jgi:predicted permease